MARPLVNADFDARERFILAKLEVYFDGLAHTPLTVNRDDYLVDFTLLEETGAESENPVGAISANELTFTLYNPNRIFSPSNPDSPYAGKININVPVKAYISVEDTEEEAEWLLLGTFFVDTWDTAIGTSIVNVSCTDKLRRILEQPMPALQVMINESYANFFRRIFEALGVQSSDVIIDSSLNKELKYSFNNDGLVIDTLQPVAEAAMCYIYMGRDNKIHIVDMLNDSGPVATFADTNQVKTVTIPQSILKTYSTVELIYSMPNISPDIVVLTIANASFIAGIGHLNRYKVSQGPVYSYSYLSVLEAQTSTIADMHCNSWEVSLDTKNTSSTPETADIEVIGNVVYANQTTIERENPAAVANIGVKPFSLTNLFVQDTIYANQYADILLNFITCDVPIIEIDARGNPLVLLCDTVLLQDDTHEVVYNTKVIRTEYRYDGGLTCNYTLLNTEVLGGEE